MYYNFLNSSFNWKKSIWKINHLNQEKDINFNKIVSKMWVLDIKKNEHKNIFEADEEIKKELKRFKNYNHS